MVAVSKKCLAQKCLLIFESTHPQPPPNRFRKFLTSELLEYFISRIGIEIEKRLSNINKIDGAQRLSLTWKKTSLTKIFGYFKRNRIQVPFIKIQSSYPTSRLFWILQGPVRRAWQREGKKSSVLSVQMRTNGNCINPPSGDWCTSMNVFIAEQEFYIPCLN